MAGNPPYALDPEAQALLDKADGISGRMDREGYAQPTPTPTPAAPKIERETVLRPALDVAKTGLKVGAKATGGGVHGVGKGYLEGLANIPYMVEKMGRHMFAAPSGPEDVAGVERRLETPESNFENTIPYVPGNEALAGVQTALDVVNPFISNKGISTPEWWEQRNKENLQSQEDYEKNFLAGAVKVGEAVPVLEGVAALGAAGGRASVKLASKIPVVKKAVESTEKGLAKMAGYVAKKSGVGDRIAGQVIKNADRAGEFKNVPDTFVPEKSVELMNHVDDFRKLRNKQYTEAMDALPTSVNNKPVKIDVLLADIREAIGSETTSPALKKYLTELIDYDFNGKTQVNFKRANEIKKTIYEKFAGYEKPQYLGSTKDDMVAARRIGQKLKDSIEVSVPEVKPINAQYEKQSTVIRNMGDVIGKPRYRVNEAGKKVRRPGTAPGKLDASMNPGSGEDLATVLDDFVREYPKATETVENIRTAIASKKLVAGSEPAGRVVMGGGQPKAIVSEPLGGIKKLAFDAPRGLLGKIQQSRKGPWLLKPEGSDLPQWAQRIGLRSTGRPSELVGIKYAPLSMEREK